MICGKQDSLIKKDGTGMMAETVAIFIFSVIEKSQFLKTQSVCPFGEPRWVHGEPIRRLNILWDTEKRNII